MNINLDKIDYNSGGISEMREHLLSFEHYIQDAQIIADNFALPSYFINCSKIVFCGMGASGIGAKIIKDLLFNSQKIIEVVSDYHLPNWVDKNTLIIALSNSGNTEEVLGCFVEGYQKEAKLLAITTGGKLKSLCSKFRSPIIEYAFISEPKLAIAYLFIIPLLVLNRLGIYDLEKKSITNSILLLQKQNKKVSTQIQTLINPAKDFSTKLFEKNVFIISSSNLKSVGERFSQSINEDAKQFSSFNFLPEINHNLIAGLDHPKDGLTNFIIVILESKFADSEIKKRQNITAAILNKKRINYLRLSFDEATDELSEIIMSINFLSFVAYYLGILNQVNPISADTISYIKSELYKE